MFLSVFIKNYLTKIIIKTIYIKIMAKNSLKKILEKEGIRKSDFAKKCDISTSLVFKIC